MVCVSFLVLGSCEVYGTVRLECYDPRSVPFPPFLRSARKGADHTVALSAEHRCERSVVEHGSGSGLDVDRDRVGHDIERDREGEHCQDVADVFHSAE